MVGVPEATLAPVPLPAALNVLVELSFTWTAFPVGSAVPAGRPLEDASALTHQFVEEITLSVVWLRNVTNPDLMVAEALVELSEVVSDSEVPAVIVTDCWL